MGRGSNERHILDDSRFFLGEDVKGARNNRLPHVRNTLALLRSDQEGFESRNPDLSKYDECVQWDSRLSHLNVSRGGSVAEVDNIEGEPVAGRQTANLARHARNKITSTVHTHQPTTTGTVCMRGRDFLNL